jgi:NADH:ubiquinone oxidoreductase subunit E
MISDILNHFNEGKRDELIPVLLAVQCKLGFISEVSVKEIANHLHLTTSAIYSVASFYDGLLLQASKPFQVTICRGLSCYKAGTEALKQDIEQKIAEQFKLQKQISNSISVAFMPCRGQCNKGPVVFINEEKVENATPISVLDKIKYIIDKTNVQNI